jgi:hypothetical protein
MAQTAGLRHPALRRRAEAVAPERIDAAHGPGA